MPADRLLNWVVMMLVFGLVLAVWLAGAILWLRQRAWRARYMERRLGLEESALTDRRVLRLWKDGRESTTTVLSRRKPVFERIEDACLRAGWDVPASTLVFSVLSLTTLLFVVVLLVTSNPLLSLGVVTLCLFLARMWMEHKVNQRMTVFEAQLIDGLELAARSLRSGHPLSASFRLIAEEIKPPVSTVFGEICQRQTMGVPMEEALRLAAARAGSADLNLFAASVVIQIRSGGNLADMMDRLACVIRARRRLRGRVRVLAAQTQLSKRILIGMPVLMFVILNAINPQYMRPMYDSHAGRLLLGIATAGVALGAWIMHRLSIIRY